eukprot:9502292-Pyramimonas_sp.AAC.2
MQLAQRFGCPSPSRTCPNHLHLLFAGAPLVSASRWPPLGLWEGRSAMVSSREFLRGVALASRGGQRRRRGEKAHQKASW